MAVRPTSLLASLTLLSGLALGCGDAEPPPATDRAAVANPALVDEALLAELLGESVEVDGDRVTADAILVRLAFEPLIRGTGTTDLQMVQGQGYRLSGVAEREPLWQLGLRDGDVLTLVDGQPILAREHELRSQWEARPNRAELTYLRGEETRVLKLEIRSGASWKGTEPSVDEPTPGDEDSEALELPPSSDGPDAADFSQSLRCTPGSGNDLGQCELERAAIDMLLSDTKVLARQMRVVPSERDGRTVGFKLSAIRRSSIPSQVGLRNGDLITAVNGRSLTSLEAVMEAYTRLSDATELLISLERRSEKHTLKVVLVDALSGPPSALPE